MGDPIEWRDPPLHLPGSRRRMRPGAWRQLIAPLLNHPGRWAMIRRHDTPAKARDMAKRYRVQAPKWFEGAWEFVSIECEVFARYLGEE